MAELADALADVVMGDCRRDPSNAEEISATEKRLEIRLPDDLRAFYEQMDGTADMTDADHGLITVWPLDRWKHLRDEAPELSSELPADAVVFADHSLWCWAYAASFDDPTPGRLNIYTVGLGAPQPIASSFTEFIAMIVTNSEKLHGTPANPTLQRT